MLKTSKERVLLLKAGYDGKEIEKLYCILNRLLVIDNTFLPVVHKYWRLSRNDADR